MAFRLFVLAGLAKALKIYLSMKFCSFAREFVIRIVLCLCPRRIVSTKKPSSATSQISSIDQEIKAAFPFFH
jgi:hypothetical protein